MARGEYRCPLLFLMISRRRSRGNVDRFVSMCWWSCLICHEPASTLKNWQPSRKTSTNLYSKERTKDRCNENSFKSLLAATDPFKPENMAIHYASLSTYLGITLLPSERSLDELVTQKMQRSLLTVITMENQRKRSSRLVYEFCKTPCFLEDMK